jgi:hypothetical protein
MEPEECSSIPSSSQLSEDAIRRRVLSDFNSVNVIGDNFIRHDVTARTTVGKNCEGYTSYTHQLCRVGETHYREPNIQRGGKPRNLLAAARASKTNRPPLSDKLVDTVSDSKESTLSNSHFPDAQILNDIQRRSSHDTPTVSSEHSLEYHKEEQDTISSSINEIQLQLNCKDLSKSKRRKLDRKLKILQNIQAKAMKAMAAESLTSAGAATPITTAVTPESEQQPVDPDLLLEAGYHSQTVSSTLYYAKDFFQFQPMTLSITTLL